MKIFKKLQYPFLFLFFAFQFAACAQEPAAQTKPAALRKPDAEIAAYVRKVFNVPASVGITVRDNESKIPGLAGIMLTFHTEKGNQDQEAWVTPDNVLIVGRTYDMTVDPYKKNWEKISFANVPVTGAADAKVTIVEYSDFQCPYCSRAHVTVQDVLKQYAGKVKLIYKHLPLNIHNWAQDAAIASTCVYKQNPETFWKLSDYLFTNQQTIKKETLSASVLEFAKGNSLNTDDLQKCIADPATLESVKANITEANSLGFGSTPSFIINGRSVVGAIPLEEFKQVVDEALATAQ